MEALTCFDGRLTVNLTADPNAAKTLRQQWLRHKSITPTLPRCRVHENLRAYQCHSSLLLRLPRRSPAVPLGWSGGPCGCRYGRLRQMFTGLRIRLVSVPIAAALNRILSLGQYRLFLPAKSPSSNV